MKLVSMKLSAEKAKSMTEPAMTSKDAPAYPYGLRISLENDALKKLKIDPLPAVGDTLQLVALVEIVEVSQRDSADGGERRSMGLQITEMALGPSSDQTDAATAKLPQLYAKKG